MINITRIKPTQNKFLSFFMEAEDDEEEKPARKMKVISVKPDNRSKKFDNIINRAKENENAESNNEDEMELVDDMEEDEMPDTDDPMDDASSNESSDNDSDDTENTDSETNDISDNTETDQNESENTSDETEDNSSNEDEGPNTDDPMDNSDEIDELSDSIDEDIEKEKSDSESTDNSADDSDNSDGPNTSDPMADGDDGSSDDSDTDDGDGSDGSDNSADSSNASGENNGAGIDYDSMRKYNLFKNFISLYYGIDKYLDRIEAMIKDDPESNTVINDCIKRLHELKQLTYDYIIIKYNPAPYVQSMLFYQRLIASIEIIFKLVSSLNVKEEKRRK